MLIWTCLVITDAVLNRKGPDLHWSFSNAIWNWYKVERLIIIQQYMIFFKNSNHTWSLDQREIAGYHNTPMMHRSFRAMCVTERVLYSREPEPQVLDYPTQQHKLFTLLATSYAFFFVQQKMVDMYGRINEEIGKGEFGNMQEVSNNAVSYHNWFSWCFSISRFLVLVCDYWRNWLHCNKAHFC